MQQLFQKAATVLQNVTFLTKCVGKKILSRITCKKTLSFFDTIQYQELKIIRTEKENLDQLQKNYPS